MYFFIIFICTIYNNINFILNKLNNIVYIVIKREDYIILFTLIIYKILYLKLFKKLFYFYIIILFNKIEKIMKLIVIYFFSLLK